jgi:DNA-binding NarL/FixJ family response regulator
MLIVSEDKKGEYADVAVDRLVSRSTEASKLFESLMELGGKIQLTRPFVREGRRAYGNGNELTRREYEVAQLVARGMPNRRISEVTGLREQSVKNLVSVIMRKLNCENRVQVALKLTKGGVSEESLRD